MLDINKYLPRLLHSQRRKNFGYQGQRKWLFVNLVQIFNGNCKSISKQRRAFHTL